ncbi:hypothetical protein OBBRIDRAFT_804742 [Obba rivulosa]|uniref:Uncharacterized protein n=1 Tax=Obba rivulosa TaxID=1052685 RepID=A0A8E2DJU2_9APHY|nr:hypothetical protein OBBRIDRAFT_804742 [Obba rivulosa]
MLKNLESLTYGSIVDKNRLHTNIFFDSGTVFDDVLRVNPRRISAIERQMQGWQVRRPSVLMLSSHESLSTTFYITLRNWTTATRLDKACWYMPRAIVIGELSLSYVMQVHPMQRKRGPNYTHQLQSSTSPVGTATSIWGHFARTRRRTPVWAQGKLYFAGIQRSAMVVPNSLRTRPITVAIDASRMEWSREMNSQEAYRNISEPPAHLTHSTIGSRLPVHSMNLEVVSMSAHPDIGSQTESRTGSDNSSIVDRHGNPEGDP